MVQSCQRIIHPAGLLAKGGLFRERLHRPIDVAGTLTEASNRSQLLDQVGAATCSSVELDELTPDRQRVLNLFSGGAKKLRRQVEVRQLFSGAVSEGNQKLGLALRGSQLSGVVPENLQGFARTFGTQKITQPFRSR